MEGDWPGGSAMAIRRVVSVVGAVMFSVLVAGFASGVSSGGGVPPAGAYVLGSEGPVGAFVKSDAIDVQLWADVGSPVTFELLDTLTVIRTRLFGWHGRRNWRRSWTGWR